MSSSIISGQREREKLLCQENVFHSKTVFMTFDRESEETEGGRGAGQEQTTCLQGAQE